MDTQEYIRQAMQSAGYSTRRLSAELGKTSTYISNSLRCNKSITVGNLVKIGDILGFEVIVRDKHGETRLDR